MENSNKASVENEEVSLIDIITVLIRYRKLILIGTLIPTIIVAIYLFFVKPKIKPKMQPYENTTITYTIRLNNIPQKLIEALIQNYNRWWDFNGRMLQDFINPTIIGPLYEKNQFSEECAEGAGETFIKPYIDSKKITCSMSLDTSYNITINMPVTSEEKLNDFMNAFIQYEHDLIQDIYIRDHIETLLERYQRRLNEVQNANPNTVNYEEIQKAKDIIQDIGTYKRENKPFYEIQGKPVIQRNVIYPNNDVPKKVKIKRLIIALIGSFCIFTFIAFLLNMIQNIKEDPNASRKIKDAWYGGRFKK